jgi:hypothetical protein
MSATHPVNKTFRVLIYFSLLYYLLPFRPVYLYYVYQLKSAQAIHTDGKPCLEAKTALSCDFAFPKKDKSRFHLGFLIEISPISYTCRQTHFELQAYLPRAYSNPFLLCNSNRGPPSV